ncbi:porin family protein [Marinifilum sp.]|uniref:porin family protein n=1 Tax=Marinifilum sp. TaxID=2033137 RepID=UPI003BAB62C8
MFTYHKLNNKSYEKTLLLVAVLFVGTSLFAQDVKFGLKGGLNFANFKGDDPDGDVKTDIYLGGFLRVELTETIDFQPELVYSRQGMKVKEDGVDGKWKTNYLNLPLLLRASMFQSESFHGIFGPQIGFHLSSEVEGSEGDLTQSVDVDDMMRGIDFSLAFGFEYDINEQFSIGLRYNLGLSEIIDYEDLESDAKHSVFQLGASIAF